THTLEYNWTGIGEQVRNFTSVGLLNGEKFMYYDNSTAKIIQTEWMKELESDLPPKQRETWDVEGQQDWLRSKLRKVQALELAIQAK
ncbi:BOLA class I histocompatibility antigen, alpha chain BL3-7-like isoform X2, partial [Clarias magur]